MSNYKSKHTGAQVDEAVSKVLNGEVGGGADWNAQEGEAGYIENRPFGFDGFKEVKWQIDEYGSYYYCLEVSNQIKINGIVYDISEDLTDINGVGFIVAEDGIHVHGAGEDYLKSILVKVGYKIDEKYLPNTVLKTTPQSLSDEDKSQVKENLGISTPDWNAQAGEAGYIDNKPFGEGFKAVNWFYDDNASFCITPMISNKVKYEGVIYEIPDNTDDGPVSLGDGSIALGKYPYYDDNLMYVTGYGIQDESDERLKKILFKTNVKLNSDNIDDTVIKTTPQSLSDTDKNQALTNLGIDPVVWKYICNPCIIKTGEKVPEELIGEYSGDIGEYGGYYLKYHNLGMYKIQITSNRINSEFGEGVSVILTPSSMSEAYLNINDVYISKDYGVYMGSVYIDENKNWCIS